MRICAVFFILVIAGCTKSSYHAAEPEPTSDFHQAPQPRQSIVDSNELPDLTSSSTLEDYLEYASLNNAALEAAYHRWQAAIEQIPQAKALPDPEVSFGQYVRQSDMQMESMVEVMQEFPWPGTLDARSRAAYAQAQAMAHSLESVRLDLYQKTKKEFYEFLYLQDAIAIAEENLELIRHFEQVAMTKYITAAGTHPDIIRAQIELANLDLVLVNLRQLVKPQTARLNALLDRPADAPLPWPQKPSYALVAADSETLTQLLKEKNPQLAQMGSMIEAARQELKLATLRRYPNVGVGVEWTDFERSGGMSGRDSIMVLFKMNLPIWTDSYRAAERQAQANVRAAARERKQTENQLAADVAQALYALEESQRKIQLYEGVIPKTEQLVNASETAYRGDTVDFLSLIDAQRMLLEYHLQYRRAQADYQQRLAELEALVGAQL
ncbi:MAG: TolC family protein [Planctomycetaceae bacterium]|nr:TolC family protein [Planctomycetaceae bacterium]